MGGEVTVYSGWEPEERGMSGISRKLSPDMSLDIMEEEELENDEEEEDENEVLLDMELEPIELELMFIPPILDIILLIMSSMSPSSASASPVRPSGLASAYL